MLTAVVPQLIQYGKVDRGVIGILAQDFSTTLANAMNISDHDGGAIITAVAPYSPAKNAGLHVGDIVLKIDNTAIHTASQVVNTVGFMRVGTEVTMTLLRNGKEIKTSVTIMAAEKQKALTQLHSPYFNHASLQDISFYSSENGDVNGVALMNIEKDSTEWIAGLRAGDIILSANGTLVTTVHGLQEIIAKAKDSLALLVLHLNAAAYVVLTPEGQIDDKHH
jgi:serine protease Do